MWGGCSSASGGGDEAPSFSVTYFTEHGSAPASIKVEENSALSSAQLPELYADGYTFNGWEVSSASSGSATGKAEAGYKVASDITLTANWTAITYSITFVTNGGSFAESCTPPSNYTIESDEITLPAADKITKPGAAFKGWFENADDASSAASTGSGQAASTGSKAITKIEKGSFGDKTFYARWADSIYSIIYEGTDDAVLSEGVTLEGGFTSEDTQITLPTSEQISRTGYTFGGWFTEDAASATEPPVTSLKSTSAVKGETLTLYAKWTPITYTITYELDGGTWAESYEAASTYTIEDEITLPAAQNVTKSGYEFDGWFKSEEDVFSTGSTTQDTGSTTSITKIEKGTTGNKTFYAKWSLATYTITYKNINGAETSNSESYTMKSDTIYLKDAVKTGYKFEGWYSENDGVVSASRTYSIPKGSSGNITLYAKWTAIKYTITFVTNNGDWASGYTAASTYTVEDEITLPTEENITRKNYTFCGWVDNYDEASPITSIEKGSTENKTFYAKWTLTSYTITYMNADGAENPNGSAYYAIEVENSVFTLNDASKDGYIFEGWYPVNDGVISESSATTIPEGSSGNKTFYAKWTAIEYTITFVTNGGAWAKNFTPASAYNVESEEITLPSSSEITRTGYTFDGWFENQEDLLSAVSTGSEQAGSTATIPKGSTGNKTFYAKWSAIVYSITYKNADGAENSNPLTYTVEDKVILKDASKAGYRFDDWYETEDCKELASIPKGSTGDKTFYAKFIPYEKWISFYSNFDFSKDSTKPYYKEIQVVDPTVDGSNYLYRQIIIFGEETAFIPVNYYADKWLFTGWNTSADGSGTSYSDKAKVLWNAAADSRAGDDVSQITESNPENISTLKLYAQWKAKTSSIYSITLPETDESDIALSKDKTEVTAKFNGFTGTYYWYIDGSDEAAYSSATRTDEESTTDLTTYSTFDCAQYIGKEGTSYGVHTVMVKITNNGNVYTQTVLVSLSPWD